MKKLLLIALLLVAMVMTMVACQDPVVNPEETTGSATDDATQAPTDAPTTPDSETDAPTVPDSETAAPGPDDTQAPTETDAPTETAAPTESETKKQEETDPPTPPEPEDPFVDPTEAGQVNASFDTFFVNGNMYFEADGGAGDKLNAIDNTISFEFGAAHDTASLRGWIGFGQAIDQFGYYIDDVKNVVYADFTEATGDDVLAAGGENASRFQIIADLSALGAGEHKVGYVVKLADGTAVRLRTELTVVIKGLTVADDIPFHTSVDFVNGSGPNGEPYYSGRGGNTGVGCDVIDGAADGKVVGEDMIFSVGGWCGTPGGINRYVWSVDGVNWNDCLEGSGRDGEPLDGHYAGLGFEDALKNGMFNGENLAKADLTAYEGQTVDITFGIVPETAQDKVVAFVQVTGIVVYDILDDTTINYNSKDNEDLSTVFTFGPGAAPEQFNYTTAPYAFGGINQLTLAMDGAYALVLKNVSCGSAHAAGFVRGNESPNFGDAHYYGHDGTDQVSVGCAGIYYSVILKLGKPTLRLNVKGINEDGTCHPNIFEVPMVTSDLAVTDNGSVVNFYNGATVLASVALSGEKDGFAEQAVVTLADGTATTLNNLVVASTIFSDIGFLARAAVFSMDSLQLMPLGSFTPEEIEIPVEYVNLALGKDTSLTTSVENETNIPANATDGDTSTRWGAFPTGEASFIVNFGEITKIHTIEMYFENTVLPWTVYVSTDGETWTEKYKGAAGGGRVVTVEFGELIELQYIKLTRDTEPEGQDSNWFSIYEFYAFGEAVVGGDDEPVDPNGPIAIIDAEKVNAGTGLNEMNPIVLNDGYVTLTAAAGAKDPFFYLPVGFFGGRYMAIKYRSATATGCAIQTYLGSEGAGPSNDSTMLEMPLTADGEWHLMVFDLDKMQTQLTEYYVSYFRFDFLQGDYVRDENGNIIYGGDNGTVSQKNPLPEGASLDVAYVAFFDSVEKAENHYNGVVTPDEPETPFEHDYVADGLVSLYQGGEAGSVWADLIGNNDVTLTVNDKNFVAADGLHAEGAKHYFPQGIVDLVNGNAFTVEIKLGDFIGHDGMAYYTFMNSDNDNFALFIRVNGDLLEFKFAGNPGGERHKIPNGLALLQNSLVTITYTVGGECTIYINGQAVETKASPKAMGANTMFIGHDGENKLFSTVYESVRFYNRALSADEVAANAEVDGYKYIDLGSINQTLIENWDTVAAEPFYGWGVCASDGNGNIKLNCDGTNIMSAYQIKGAMMDGSATPEALKGAQNFIFPVVANNSTGDVLFIFQPFSPMAGNNVTTGLNVTAYLVANDGLTTSIVSTTNGGRVGYVIPKGFVGSIVIPYTAISAYTADGGVVDAPLYESADAVDLTHLGFLLQPAAGFEGGELIIGDVSVCGDIFAENTPDVPPVVSEDDTHNFQSDIANQTDADINNSDIIGSGMFAFTPALNDTSCVVPGVNYQIGGFSSLVGMADGIYAYTVDVKSHSHPGFSAIFVRGIEALNFGDGGYFGGDGNDATAISTGCAGIYLIPCTNADGSISLRLNIKSMGADGKAVPNIFMIPAESSRITIADNGSTIYVIAGDKLAAIIEISGTRDFGVNGVAADACAAKVTVTLADGETTEIKDAVVAASHLSEFGLACRGGAAIEYTYLAMMPYSSITIPEEFYVPETIDPLPVPDGAVSVFGPADFGTLNTNAVAITVKQDGDLYYAEFAPTAGDPWVLLFAGKDTPRYMVITYRTTSAQNGEIFSGYGAGPGDPADMPAQSIAWTAKDGTWTTELINIFAKGDKDNVKYARLDFFGDNDASTFDVASIYFFESAEKAQAYLDSLKPSAPAIDENDALYPMLDGTYYVLGESGYDAAYTLTFAVTELGKGTLTIASTVNADVAGTYNWTYTTAGGLVVDGDKGITIGVSRWGTLLFQCNGLVNPAELVTEIPEAPTTNDLVLGENNVAANGAGIVYTFTAKVDGTYTFTWGAVEGVAIIETANGAEEIALPYEVTLAARESVTIILCTADWSDSNVDIVVNGANDEPQGPTIVLGDNEVAANGSGIAYTFNAKAEGTYVFSWGAVEGVAIIETANGAEEIALPYTVTLGERESFTIILCTADWSDGTVNLVVSAEEEPQGPTIVLGDNEVAANGSGIAYTFNAKVAGTYVFSWGAVEGVAIIETANGAEEIALPYEVTLGERESFTIILCTADWSDGLVNVIISAKEDEVPSLDLGDNEVAANGSGIAYTFNAKAEGTYVFSWGAVEGVAIIETANGAEEIALPYEVILGERESFTIILCTADWSDGVVNVTVTGKEPEQIKMWDVDKDIVTHQSFDELRINDVTGVFTPGHAASWDLVANLDASATFINYWGWVGVKGELGQFGYQIDDGEIIFSDSFTVAAGQDVIDAAKTTGADNASRMLIKIDLTGLTDAGHTVTVYYKNADGAMVFLNFFTVNLPKGPATITFDTLDNLVSGDGTQQVWALNGVTVTNNKTAQSSEVKPQNTPARFYKYSDVVIDYPHMTKIVITCTGTDAKYHIKDTFITTAGTWTIDGAVATLTFAEAVDSVTINCIGNQIRVEEITVYSDESVPAYTGVDVLTPFEGGVNNRVNIDSKGSDDYSAFAAGWVGFAQTMTKCGYSVDNGAIVWDGTFTVCAAGDPVLDPGNGGANAMRFTISASLAGMPYGAHTVRFYVELADGSVVVIYTLPVVTKDPSVVGNSAVNFNSAETADLLTIFANDGGAPGACNYADNTIAYKLTGITSIHTAMDGTYELTVKNLNTPNGFAAIFFRGNLNPNFGDPGYFGHDGNNAEPLSVGCAGVYASIVGGNLRINVKGEVDGKAIPHIYTVAMTGKDLKVVDDNKTLSFYEGETLLATVAISGNEAGYATEAVVTIGGVSETLTDVCCAATAASDIGFVARGTDTTFDALTIKGLAE